jgi:tRNA modification GTPase
MQNQTTICALSSALGRGSIGVVRVSGDLCSEIAKQVLRHTPKDRFAHYGSFFAKNGVEIDKGLAIFFQKPNSFTGEDVIEFQCHGGIFVIHSLLNTIIELGAVAAEPGEFSKRAFLNGKMDLLQAEAVADIINASSEQSARSALKSLSGDFSKQINSLTKELIQVRVFIESEIDFSDEDIDSLQSSKTKSKIEKIKDKIEIILKDATKGAVLREGLTIVITGEPNVGKSSLMNRLTKNSNAIVTDIAGTTRDLIKDTININGIPLNIIDTAGLRYSTDKIEQEGIKRAHTAINNADLILLVFDAKKTIPDLSIMPPNIANEKLLLIKNKIDLTCEKASINVVEGKKQLSLSAKENIGIDLLTDELVKIVNLTDTGQGVLLARKRHLDALNASLLSIVCTLKQLENNAIELAAEDLRQAAKYLGSITGEFSSDDLLGEIFSTFCIGK